MQIRKMTQEDLPSANALCLEAFMLAVAPSLSAQEVKALVEDALEEVIDREAKQRLDELGPEFERVSHETGLAALGALLPVA